MNCPTCKASLRVAKTDVTSDATNVFSNQILVCVNPACLMHETNLDSPSKVIETIRNQTN